MIEVKISGRGGQGAVLASQVLATAFFEKGFYVQSFPSFGAERRGAPVSAFLRVDSKEITLRYSVQSPDWIVLFDANLLKNPMVMAGMSGKTCLLVNTGLTQSLEALECKGVQVRPSEPGPPRPPSRPQRIVRKNALRPLWLPTRSLTWPPPPSPIHRI